MLFNSLTFLLFFVLVYSLFWILPTWEMKKLLLLIASYFFYAAWNPPYVGLLLFCTWLDWWLARRIDKTQHVQRRKALLMLSLLVNLGLLSYFKYGQFLLENFGRLIGALGIAYQPPHMSLVLPIGISFYTFASLSYTIDVYRREINAEASFTDYALFVSFFPHLVAGPIVRASLLLPQFKLPRRPTQNQIGWGLVMLVMGLFSKIVLADAIFAPVVNDFYDAPLRSTVAEAWTAVLSFSGQIYYDFSGYSLCAIGLALCFGFSFPDNFRHPYAARSFSDFWRRWHISLSTWLRDYLYIPLGGNRYGAVRTYACLALTMLIGGLWHGASWMFVLWGALHGMYLAIERGARSMFPVATTAGIERYRLSEFLIFLVVTLTWVPFRAVDASQMDSVFKSLFNNVPSQRSLEFPEIFSMVCMVCTVWWHVKLRNSSLELIFTKLGVVWTTLLLTLLLIVLYLYSGGDQRAFIYFQF